MKLCIDCKYHERKTMPVGQNQLAMVPICNHPELVGPIEGEILPCQVTRGNEQFCGISGKFFEAKPVTEALPTPKSNVIAIP